MYRIRVILNVKQLKFTSRLHFNIFLYNGISEWSWWRFLLCEYSIEVDNIFCVIKELRFSNNILYKDSYIYLCMYKYSTTTRIAMYNRYNIDMLCDGTGELSIISE